MVKRLNTTVLEKELIEVDKFLTRYFVTNGPCHDSVVFAHLLSGNDGEKFIEEGQVLDDMERRRVWARMGRLKKLGYLRYTPSSKGGRGWEVAPPYKATAEEGGTKVTVTDPEASLKGKLNPIGEYVNALELITHLRNIAPSTTVGQLYDFLKRYPEFEELCGQQDKSNETTVNIQTELEQYCLDYARFFTGEIPQELTHVNLWQLYRVCQVLCANRSVPEPTPEPTPDPVEEELDEPDGPEEELEEEQEDDTDDSIAPF